MHVHYGQIYVQSDPDHTNPDLSEAFAGQSVGLCGAAVPGALWLVTAVHTGNVDFTVEIHDVAPPLDPGWEDVVEASFRPVSERTSLVQWAGEAAWDLDLTLTDYRVRYCAQGMDEGRELDTRGPEDPPAESYLLQFWPAPPGPDRVIRQTSQNAAYWHRYARELPPPPTPEQRAEAEYVARQEEQRAAEEQRLHHEQWEWGGRLPSEGLRGARQSNVLGLLRFDSHLVHALDAAGPEAQRAVALLAARRACEAAALTDVPWVAHALAELAEERPLPPPFDDTARMWETLRCDPCVPERSVLQATPPERAPYRPPTPPADVRHTAIVEVHVTGTPRAPERISQPHFALPAVLAAAEPSPLKSALDAVWHAVNTYGEHYPELLAEIWSACAEKTEK
ncbi:hypothetical protein [Streptomyces sp. NPDC047315]|uniref:hypothetical protein n=1 Tax=Streptomyces sp. NPDC047315 TaxID=3155142 RepID=UPI0034061E20